MRPAHTSQAPKQMSAEEKAGASQENNASQDQKDSAPAPTNREDGPVQEEAAPKMATTAEPAPLTPVIDVEPVAAKKQPTLQVPTPVLSDADSDRMGSKTSKGSRGVAGRASARGGDKNIRVSVDDSDPDGKPPRPSQLGAREKTQRKSRAQQIVQSNWYQSSEATYIRRVMSSKAFNAVIALSLVLALFLPDVWILSGVNNNLIIDVILTAVMAIMVLEVIVRCSVDVEYLYGDDMFFFVMDILGTISMITDISYMLGQGHEEAETMNSALPTQQVMLLRAARTAKVGARAGRLSRLLRLLRFIPFLAMRNAAESLVGESSMVSGKLANLISTRVACLTIILIMVIPAFDLMNFPARDLSVQTWTERISTTIAAAQQATNTSSPRWQVVSKELNMMTDYYKDNEFTLGPYMACVGKPIESGDEFMCDEDQPRSISSWYPSLTKPPRGASELLVYTDVFMVSFNLHMPIQLESGLQIATMFFIIFMMIFSGLALSSVVNTLAVQPLEAMLVLVRKVARTVLKIETEQERENIMELDSMDEAMLLEKVVGKLATIAELQTKDYAKSTVDMGDEDLGVVGLAQTTGLNNTKSFGAAESPKRSQKGSKSKEVGIESEIALALEEARVTVEMLESWSFSPFDLTKEQMCSLCVHMISDFHAGDGFITDMEDMSRLRRFISAVEKEYNDVRFHSFMHAVDVVHGVSKMMRLNSSNRYLSELEQFSLLIAGSAHDLGHEGVNNAFLVEVGHDLALQYNDQSPLENMHCAKLYKIIAVADTNVFAKMSPEQYKESRKICIETILHTDMVTHFGMVNNLQMTYQMNTEVFTEKRETDTEWEVFKATDTKMLTMECILHSADVSNPARAFEVTRNWGMRCVDEFFAQGDQEKQLGIAVGIINDRDKVNRPASQIGFIEFVIAPFFVAQIRLWPGLSEYGDNLAYNIAKWEEAWIEDVSPSDEEKAKKRASVERVANNVEDAKPKYNT